MPMRSRLWKVGRGTLGPLQPLLGSWEATMESKIGPLSCTRSFTQELGGKFIVLRAAWKLPGKAYEELALFGSSPTGTLAFWSYTSDGKRSEGQRAEAGDIHPECLAFEAEMPAGLARMLYWPEADGGLGFAVESRTKKGWNRFVHHHYHSVAT
jgi:hypothetical protein